jgi:hypothetical protein
MHCKLRARKAGRKEEENIQNVYLACEKNILNFVSNICVGYPESKFRGAIEKKYIFPNH